MLDQLVESRSNAGDNVRRGGFLLTTLVIVVSLFLGALLYSLFTKDFGLGSGDLELSALVAPVPVPAEEPPPPEPDQPKEQPKDNKPVPNADVREKIIQDLSESPQKPPDTISVQKQNIPPRRFDVLTVQGDKNLNANNPAPSNYRGEVDTNNKGIGGGGNDTGAGGGGDEPPPPPPKPTPTPKPIPKKVSLGVINGKASRLVQPPYPAAARAVHASGTVNVSINIDENGNVTSANAVSGHPLLRQAAEQAARQSKFTPTVLSGQPVSVTGIIVYNFVAQ